MIIGNLPETQSVEDNDFLMLSKDNQKLLKIKKKQLFKGTGSGGGGKGLKHWVETPETFYRENDGDITYNPSTNKLIWECSKAKEMGNKLYAMEFNNDEHLEERLETYGVYIYTENNDILRKDNDPDWDMSISRFIRPDDGVYLNNGLNDQFIPLGPSTLQDCYLFTIALGDDNFYIYLKPLHMDTSDHAPNTWYGGDGTSGNIANPVSRWSCNGGSNIYTYSYGCLHHNNIEWLVTIIPEKWTIYTPVPSEDPVSPYYHEEQVEQGLYYQFGNPASYQKIDCGGYVYDATGTYADIPHNKDAFYSNYPNTDFLYSVVSGYNNHTGIIKLVEDAIDDLDFKIARPVWPKTTILGDDDDIVLKHTILNEDTSYQSKDTVIITADGDATFDGEILSKTGLFVENNGVKTPVGPVIVTPVVQSGTEIAKINNISIYAPSSGGGGGGLPNISATMLDGVPVFKDWDSTSQIYLRTYSEISLNSTTGSILISGWDSVELCGVYSLYSKVYDLSGNIYSVPYNNNTYYTAVREQSGSVYLDWKLPSSDFTAWVSILYKPRT